MCLAVPAQLVKVNGYIGTIELDTYCAGREAEREHQGPFENPDKSGQVPKM